MNERITRVPSETDGEAEVKSDVHGWELSEKGGVVMMMMSLAVMVMKLRLVDLVLNNRENH